MDDFHPGGSCTGQPLGPAGILAKRSISHPCFASLTEQGNLGSQRVGRKNEESHQNRTDVHGRRRRPGRGHGPRNRRRA
jgi:hypothetical protein